MQVKIETGKVKIIKMMEPNARRVTQKLEAASKRDKLLQLKNTKNIKSQLTILIVSFIRHV